MERNDGRGKKRTLTPQYESSSQQHFEEKSKAEEMKGKERKEKERKKRKEKEEKRKNTKVGLLGKQSFFQTRILGHAKRKNNKSIPKINFRFY